MKINKKLLNPIRIKIFIICSIFAAAGLAGLYLFFNIQDTAKTSDIPIAVPAYDQSNKFEPVVLDNDRSKITNTQLYSKSYNSADINDNQKEELQEIFNDSIPDDSVKNNESMNLNELFKDSVINQHTLNVTEMIQTKFSTAFNENAENLWSHYNQVEEFLRTQFDDEAKVEEFLNFYKKHTEHELAQARDPNFLWRQTPENPEEAMRLNSEKQQYLRDVFGRETADTLWGDETKVHEYKMKELEILRADAYSAQVKEQLIKDLREQTFGDANGQQDTDYSYQLYLKLAIYSEELMELSPEERDEKIEEFRIEIYPPDKLQFLEYLEDAVETDSEETTNADKETM